MMLDARKVGCGANGLLVLDAEGRLTGVLTSRSLFAALLDRWVPEGDLLKDRQALEERLFEAGRDYLALPAEDLSDHEVEPLSPDDRLPRMMERFVSSRLEALPVLDQGKLLGVVLLVDVYRAAVALALRPEDEGIRIT